MQYQLVCEMWNTLSFSDGGGAPYIVRHSYAEGHPDSILVAALNDKNKWVTWGLMRSPQKVWEQLRQIDRFFVICWNIILIY